MRRVRTLEGSVFEDFSKVELGGPLGNFSNAGPSILCAGCVLGRLAIPFCAQAADFGDGGEGDDAGGGPSLHP